MRRNLENRDLYIALLAAGKAKRMNSGKAKFCMKYVVNLFYITL